jgi:penicillin-binding protein 2
VVAATSTVVRLANELMAATTSTTTELPPRDVAPRAEPEAAAEPYRPTPRLTWRVAILGAVLLAIFAALFLRLWALQVLAGSKYVGQAQANSYVAARVLAPRGLILDRNRVPLVTNAPATAVLVWPADLPKVYLERFAELRRIARVTRVPLYEISRGIKQRRGDPITPVVVRETASKAMYSYLAEHASEFPGVTTGTTYLRHYPYHELAAQVLGYVGAISQAQLRRLGQGYDLNDQLGQSGVEAAYDRYLRGVDGDARLHVDSLGRPHGQVQVTTLPRAGHVVRLTLDLHLQQAAERALANGIQLARNNGQWAAAGGAIVALDPRDGSILAMASSPTYKPSVYTGHVTRQALASEGLTTKTAATKNYPSLDRATQATYPPGSVFKPLTALAAMQEHLVSPYAYLPCTATYHSPHDKAHEVFHNWDPNISQQMDLPTALAYSCDTYFYQLGDDFWALPPSRKQPLQFWAAQFGFGRLTGSDVGPEVPGLVPTIAWRQHHFRTAIDKLWKPGNSIQLAIGQGDLLVTPLQMARFYAALANGGRLVTPHLLLDVENPNGTAVPVPALPAPKPVNVDPAALQVVRQGLWEGTHLPFGTSYPVFGSFPVSIAGKTGTAEKVVELPGYLGTQNQSWWCGYGPTQDAKLVVCAVIENGGHGGSAAAPAAEEVFASYFHVKVKTATSSHSD